MTEINYQNFNDFCLKDYCMLTTNSHIKIKLSKLGIGYVVDISKNKNWVTLKDLNTNYVVYLKFSRVVLNLFLGCVWGEMYVFIKTAGRCVVELKPFSKQFNQSLFVDNTIQRLVINVPTIQTLKLNSYNLSLDGILTLINNKLLSGCKIDKSCNFYTLYTQKLSYTTQFLLTNLHLTIALLNGASKLNKSIQRSIVNCLKGLKGLSQSQIYCFVSKLKTYVHNEQLNTFLTNVLNLYKPKKIYNFEYFWTYVLGIRLQNNVLYLSSPQLQYQAQLLIQNKTIKIQTGKKGQVLVDGVEHVGLDGVPLNSDAQFIQLNCSINK